MAAKYIWYAQGIVGYLVKATMKAYKTIFNSKGKKDLGNRLLGTSAQLFPWYADRDSLTQIENISVLLEKPNTNKRTGPTILYKLCLTQYKI